MENKIYKLSDEEFRELIGSSLNISEILFKLGYNRKDTWAYGLIRNRMSELDCSFSRKKEKTDKLPNFSEHSKHSRGVLRRYILENNILPYKCACCGIDKWNGKTLSLQIDHINGIVNDNRLENLRLLCPNCYSQLTTEGAMNSRTLTPEMKAVIIDDYIKTENIDKVASKFGLLKKDIRSILSKEGFLKPNQKFVIQYDCDGNELRRFGSIGECCRYLINNGFVRTKKVSTCRAEFFYHKDDIWEGHYRFKIIGCLEDNK